MADVFYAVIALKQKDIAGVLEKLKAQQLNDLAQWLEASGNQIYGGFNEHWKPFKSKTIEALIGESSGFRSGTDVIDELDDKVSNIYRLRKSPIAVYFIDAFALYLDKYEMLARTIDFAVSEDALCCLVIDEEMPQQVQKQLKGRYCDSWKLVCWSYREGKAHRIAAGVGDLKNFLNSSRSRGKDLDRPSTAADRELTRREDWPEGSLPVIG